jgi:hypothetical protein
MRSIKAATSMLLVGWTSLSLRSLLSTPPSHAHPQTILWDKALDYILSNDCDLANFLKTPQAKQADSTLRICKGAS